MESYTDFASIYDVFMDDVPYEEWADRIVRIIKEYDCKMKTTNSDGRLHVADGNSFSKTPSEESGLDSELLDSEARLLLDLGCGTGVMTRLMRDRGFDCIGVDASMEMLEIAREKEDSEAPILYLCQDMRELDLYSTVGTVISTCDCINYLLEEKDVLQTFLLVENFLYPGGLFIFDFNTAHKYRDVIGDATIAENRPEGSFIWENFYDEETGINEYDLTLYIRKDIYAQTGLLFDEEAVTDSDTYIRTQETHTQRGYEPAVIADLIKEAGLELVLCFDSDTESEVDFESERVCMVARKRV